MKISKRKLRWNIPLCISKQFEVFPSLYNKKVMSCFGNITTYSLTLVLDVKGALFCTFQRSQIEYQ